MKKISARPTALFLAMAGAAGIMSNAHADWNVAVGDASANGAWSGGSPDIWTPSASGATVSATEISARLNGGTPVEIRTSGGGAEAGDIDVGTAVNWNTGKLTFSAWRNIAIKAGLGASGGAQLALEYGQGAVNAGNTSNYHLSNGAKVNLPAGANFSTRLGNNVVATDWTVITDLGLEGDATVAPGVMTLQGMNTGLAGNYVLGADIAASGTSTWNAGAGFTPVGTSATKFTGSFDGLGHTITGLTIYRWDWLNPAHSYQGLFGYAGAGSKLRNVGLLNSSIYGGNVVGALAGRSDGDISYSYADGGSVTVSVSTAGGLVGFFGGSTISNSYANVSVSGAGAGGASSSAIGGLVGNASAGSISNSYATGSVSAGTYSGGLVGQNNANIDTSYASGAVSCTNLKCGGFIGDQVAGTITNGYWDSTATGLGGIGWNHGGTVTSLTDIAAAPNAQASYAGFDFAGSWRIYEGQTRPLLKSFLTPLTVTANDASKVYDGLAYSGGNGVTYSTAPDANLLGAVGYGGTSQGAVSVGSYTITAGGFHSNQRGYDIAYAAGTLTIEAWLSHAGPTATGSGSASATVEITSGGGAACGFTVAQFVALPVAPPPGVTFPQGLFDFSLGGCDAGTAVTLTVTYPQVLPAGAQYWKYGPTPDNTTPHWYILPASIAGNTATFSITDGGLGDDDLTANGTIVDQGGPGVPIAAVPTLGEWGLLMLSVLLGATAPLRRRFRA